jgi:hypothetical protein
LKRAHPVTAHETRADHRGLHRAEQQQRTGRCRQPDIGEREQDRVREQCDAGAEAAAQRRRAVAPPDDQPQRQRAPGKAQRGEARGVDRAVAQRGTAQQRVAREREHRDDGERRR